MIRESPAPTRVNVRTPDGIPRPVPTTAHVRNYRLSLEYERDPYDLRGNLRSCMGRIENPHQAQQIIDLARDGGAPAGTIRKLEKQARARLADLEASKPSAPAEIPDLLG